MTVRTANGFALIDLIFVCGIIGVLSSIAIPRLTTARMTAGAASAIGSMRAINSAQLTYALTCASGFYAPNLTTLGVMPFGSHEPFISPSLSLSDTVTRSGYTIQLTATAYAGAPSTCNSLAAGMAGQGFKAGADPVGLGNGRFFGTNSTNTIIEDTATLYATMPEVTASLAGHPLR